MVSYLPEVFEIALGTGRRISAVCSLRVEDLDLERNGRTPQGTIVWPEDIDKMGKRWRCRISRPCGTRLRLLREQGRPRAAAGFALARLPAALGELPKEPAMWTLHRLADGMGWRR